MKVENALRPGDDQMEAFFGPAGVDRDGPVVMVNLLKFRAKAAYPDGSDAHISGFEAYTRYGMAVKAIIERLGGRMIYVGIVDGLMIGECEELWDQVALVEYPSRAALLEMVNSPEYHAIELHRDAGLAGQLNIGAKTLLSL
ncbi:DUF1330 domain-containing protein [Parvibaculum sp.]|uniref:DUF1330 domain-containing protein n=1 Tax=Parvibaculum sp. TaxID=2024848 RepID=UPI00391884F1